MGLDMYLEGRKYRWTDWKNPENDPKEDGFRIKEKILELGYWRKHPNLHGYIVEHFADGKDECQEINITEENIQELIDAVKNRLLPETTGFFFGKSAQNDLEIKEEMKTDLKILNDALQWLVDEKNISCEIRSIVYQASW